MSIEIVRGTSQKPASSEALADILSRQPDLSGQLFIGYPIIGTPVEGRHLIDALWVSEDKGAIVFDLIEGNDTDGYASRQDDSANKLESRLKLHRDLLDRRQLLIAVHAISFAPAVSSPGEHQEDYYPLANRDSLLEELNRLTWTFPDGDIYKATLSAIENISAIRQSRTRRSTTRENSRGAKLKDLEASIATLDALQSKAVIETVEGVQRLRGLAGSGKTVVLALKAAYLHAQHPEWRIAVTFYTRSLKEQFRRLINNFCLEQTSSEPNWENLRILSSWGGAGGPESDGLYYEFCRSHGVDYLNFGAASSRFGNDRAFSGACSYALKQVKESQPVYDAILVDEAQDFSPFFLRLCYEFLKNPKRLVYAYDELQSLSEASLPAPEDIFGKHSDGSPVVKLSEVSESGPQRDIILEKCYRNSRPILVTAHALGFGIYRKPPQENETGLIQMFGNSKLWEDVGYRVKQGVLDEGHSVTLARNNDTSPRFLEEHSSIDDIIQFKLFDDELKQAEWLADAIERNLSEDELRYDDIVVVNPDPRTTRSRVGPTRHRLLEMGINSHTVGVDTDPNTFFQPDSITFTGIYRAKGNEAGMIYIINAQDCHSAAVNLATIRNRLFTAITRSKAWVQVLGIGSGMQHLIEEYEMLRSRNFELEFKYPTEQQRERLRVIHRELTPAEVQQREGYQTHLDALVEGIRAGNFHIEDLDRDTLAAFKELLSESDADA